MSKIYLTGTDEQIAQYELKRFVTAAVIALPIIVSLLVWVSK